MKDYRKLSEEEVLQLKSQSCLADNWEDILSAHHAYILALYRHRPELINRLKAITDHYSNKHSDSIGTIGSHVMILNTGSIKNVRIGDYSHLAVLAVCQTAASTAML